MFKRLRFHELFLAMLFLLFFTAGAIGQKKPSETVNIIEQIRKVEKQFETDLNKFGAAYAFEKYAAPDAVIKRQNDALISGSKAIGEFYSGDGYKNAKATWSPDYVGTSADGTLAYTYGKYQWTFINDSGQTQTFSGVFHTVWKKQKDGTWKYVWD